MSWLFENAVEPMLRVTRDGRLREANLRAREIFGLPSTSPGPVSGDAPDVFELIARRHRADPPDSLALLRAGLPVPGGRFSLCRPESSLVSARWYLVEAHRDLDSPAADLLLRFSEHTERVRLELESRTFQSIISHKLRTPLNGVGSMLDFLLDEPGHLAGPEARELALSARECARRLEGTLLSIMRYHAAICGSTVSAAPGAPRPWSELLLEAAAEAGVPRGRLFLAGDPPPLLAPALVGPMRMVLGELAANYLKFADVAQGGLEARFESPAGAPARLRLFSPGPALAPELIARLGRPYWQIEKSFTGEVPGMGLGLATCRLLLASLGAELAFSASDHPPGLVSLVILPTLS